MTKPLAILPLLLAIGYASAQDNPKRWTLELETGFTAPRYNNAQVPKDTGTSLDLAGLVGKNWRPFGRLSLLYQDPKGGTWKLLVAPFRQSGSGELDAPASFASKTFAAGAAKATYQFDSYRLTYRKPWKNGWAIGGTLKVRDAEIRLEQGATDASERNVGLVPLLNLHKEGVLSGDVRYEFEMDGLAGGPGRAFDVSLRAKRRFASGTTAFVGVRVLEGGADVPRVKNFAWVTYATAGVSLPF